MGDFLDLYIVWVFVIYFKCDGFFIYFLQRVNIFLDMWENFMEFLFVCYLIIDFLFVCESYLIFYKVLMLRVFVLL